MPVYDELECKKSHLRNTTRHDFVLADRVQQVCQLRGVIQVLHNVTILRKKMTWYDMI